MLPNSSPSFDPQELLILLSKELGYQEVDEGDICYGFACMGLLAILARDTDTFYQRMEIFDSIPLKEIVTQINAIRKSRLPINKNDKTKEAKLLVDQEAKDAVLQGIPAFFEGVHLHQNPGLYSQWYSREGTPYTQDFLKTAPSILSAKLTAIEAKIISHLPFSGVYGEIELTLFFSSLRQILIKTSYPFAMLLKNSTHAITVGFDPLHPDKWIFIDANYYKDKKMIEIRGIFKDEIAEKVLAALSEKSEAILLTEIYGLKEFSQDQLKSIDALQKEESFIEMHKITTEKAHFRDENNSSWLFMMAANGELERLKEISGKGGKMDFTLRHNGSTPLMIAAKNGHCQVVTFLLEKGVGINASRFKDGATALSLAAEANQLECVKLLLSQPDVNINIRKTDGSTPFGFAVQTGNVEMINAFLQKGVDINKVCNNTGTMPLIIAANRGYLPVVEMLLQNPNIQINSVAKGGESALFMAIQEGHLDVVKVLLADNRVKIDQCRTRDKVTPLHMAVKKGYFEITKALLQAGADLNASSEHGLPVDLIPNTKQQRVAFLALFKEHRQSLNNNRMSPTSRKLT